MYTTPTNNYNAHQFKAIIHGDVLIQLTSVRLRALTEISTHIE